MPRPSLREQILESGVTTLHQRGYGAASVRDIVAAAGVPQGSFTNHFPSKEAFALAVLDRYFQRTRAIAARTLGDANQSPLARIRAYFGEISGTLSANDWRHGCLIANLSLETADLSEPLRARLAEILAGLTAPFVDAVRAGQATGEIRRDVDVEDIAVTLLAAWQGALLRSKVERSGTAIERFQRTIKSLLAPSD